MQEAVLPPLATWQNFYVITGSAAATLTGLMFVVITLRVRDRRSSGALGAFGTPTVVHFCVALLVAALLSAPWQALWHAGLLLGLSGLGGVTYVVIVLRRARRQTDYQPVLEDGAAPVHRHPQRVGQRDLHGHRTLPAPEQEPGLAWVSRRFADAGQVPWGRAAWAQSSGSVAFTQSPLTTLAASVYHSVEIALLF